MPPNITPSGLRETPHTERSASKSWLAWSQDLLSLGDSWGAGLPPGGVAFEPGRRSTTDFSPRENPSRLLGAGSAEARLSPPGCEAAWQQRAEEPGGSGLPGWPPAGPILPALGRGGVPALSPSPRAPAGIPPGALRAGGPDPPAGRGSERHLNPLLPGPVGSRCGPSAAQLFLPLGSRRGTTEVRVPSKNPGA